ncbi:SNF2 family N-terminal domain-containing protein [Mycotypha africana]|uniref:SNF2 family N-terminal domain-containing protein n=1 Tax=Mycotypha africana TaxID=64632 RepID=UPI0023006721|nr:SNF2 family N-terminal domain-containing protein [Mycotypha africana]KAI8973440.1 SNF2 family N-terminal domain-containing protein [Mycotypha africana]
MTTTRRSGRIAKKARLAKENGTPSTSFPISREDSAIVEDLMDLDSQSTTLTTDNESDEEFQAPLPVRPLRRVLIEQHKSRLQSTKRFTRSSSIMLQQSQEPLQTDNKEQDTELEISLGNEVDEGYVSLSVSTLGSSGSSSSVASPEQQSEQSRAIIDLKKADHTTVNMDIEEKAVSLKAVDDEDDDRSAVDLQQQFSSSQLTDLDGEEINVNAAVVEEGQEDELDGNYEEQRVNDAAANDGNSSSSEDDDPFMIREQRIARRQTRHGRTPHYKRTQDALVKIHTDLSNVWDDLENIIPEDVVPIEQPAELSLPLLNFQKYGVGWMLRQERTEGFNGGILADEMGMGKTIQTISLLLSDRQKPNLVVAPVVALIQWKNEIERHTNNALSVYIYHGANRSKDMNALKEYDVVLSTYQVLESSFRRQEYGVKNKYTKAIRKEKSLLHRIHWHRIILDEAHNIKDRSSNTARSVFNLEGKFKWSLTGTPLQNRVGELYSLIRFMQADPFAYYYCKECPCKEISWKFSDKRTCDSCGHTPMKHVCWWNNEVLKPIQMFGHLRDGVEAMKKLRLLLDKIMLRRTKIECADDLGLPPREVVVRRDIFSEEEEDMYTSLYSNVARQFTTFVEQGTVLNNYANIFELLMKMRQCADHPDLVTRRSADTKQLVCMLCYDPPEDAITAACKHIFCRECCIQYYQSFVDDDNDESPQQNGKPRCPSCFADFSVDLTQPAIEIESDGFGAGGVLNANYSKTSIVNRINMDKWRSSTKIEALVEELSQLRREDKTIKSIVFSQFVNFLDLIHWRLSRAGFECIRLDGSMTPDQRNAAINHFMTQPTCTVFLISLKAGGVALNLTEASRVFIMDPWWNPAAELQAMDRIHRLGQYRPIRITRLIIENSIESRIVQLQEKKQALVNSTVNKDTSALDKLTVEDLRFLFVM